MKSSIDKPNREYRTACPVCGSSGQYSNFQVTDIPVNSVHLYHCAESARAVPLGDLALYFCSCCSFIWNASFDSSKVEYSGGYEATQSFSATYRRFLEKQALAFVRQHNIYGRTILEIGCGNGEFLAAVCEAGENIGIGFDPAHQAKRAYAVDKGKYVIHIRRFDNSASLDGVSVIFCRNTLEHIDEVRDFIANIRHAIGDKSGIKVVFQVPAWERISRISAFWDIYYEHCSYFSGESLRYLFVNAGFDVSSVETVFYGQYLLLVAEVVTGRGAIGNSDNKISEPPNSMLDAGEALIKQKHRWMQRIKAWQSNRNKVVFWGGGSKAVAFLSAVENVSAFVGAVDINPHKQGTYLPSTGLRVISPEQLVEIQPQKIIIMNPVYAVEIKQQLKVLGVNSDIECLGLNMADGL